MVTHHHTHHTHHWHSHDKHEGKHVSHDAEEAKAAERMHQQVDHERHLNHKPEKTADRKGDHLPNLRLVGAKEEHHLDTHKSVHQLMKEGTIADKRDDAAKRAEGDAALKARPEANSERHAPTIEVRMQDHGKGDKTAHEKPDFIVRKNGKIEALSDPEKLHKDKVIVELERGEGEVKPTRQQQDRVNELVGYLDERVNPSSGKKEQTKIQDDHGLVSDDVKQRVTKTPPAQERFDSQTQQQMHRMERFKGGGHGRMSHREADDYFPERTVPRQRGESFRAEDLKDTVAGMFNADRQHPYDEVRQRGDHSFAVGRYGLTQRLLAGWLADKLGDPPDMSKLPELMAQLAKDGKIPQQFADQFKDENFCKDFGQFLNKLDGNSGSITAADLQKFLPKEMQESVATDLAEKFSRQAGNDAGKAALAWQLGKSPDQLSSADLSDQQNATFMDAARRLHDITQARQIAGNNDDIEWNGEPSSMAMKIAHDAQTVAQRMSTTGYCYRGVKAALRENGINLSGGAAYEAKAQLERDPRFHEVSINNLKPGDILVHPAGYANDGRAHQYGHIAVYLGNNMEASDHVQHLIRGRVTVFRLTDNA